MTNWTPLISAAFKGYTDIVRLLLSQSNIEVNCKAICKMNYSHNSIDIILMTLSLALL